MQKENAGVELRRTLLTLAQGAGLDSETMQTVERELGVQRQSGEAVAVPRSLLSRKIVARVVTAIGGDQVWQSTKDGRQMQAYRSQGRASDFATVSAAAAGASEARTVAVVHDELSAQKFNELATAVAGRMRQAVLGAGGNENRAAELQAHFDGVLNGCLKNAAADYRGLVESCSLQHVSEDDVERFLMATASRILLSETDLATTKAFLGTEAFANSRVGLELDVLRQCRQFGPACYPYDPTRLLRDYVAAMNRTGVPKDAGRVQHEVGHWRLDFGDDASRAPDVRAEVRGPLSSVRCLADLLGAKAKPDGSGPFIRRLLADAVGTEGTMIGWASTLDAAGDLGGEAFAVLNARMKEAHETLMEFERLTGREIGQAFQAENPNLAARATFDRMIASQQALADQFESAAGEVRDGSAMRMRASSIRQRICEISRLAGELTQRVREEQQGQVHDVGLDRAWTTSQLPTISGDSPEIAQALMTADEDLEFAFTELERIGETDGPLSNERLGEVAHCLRGVSERLETFKGRVRDGAALAALQRNLCRAADLFEKKNEAVGRRLAEQMVKGISCPSDFEEDKVPEKIKDNIPEFGEFYGLMRNYRKAAMDYISTGKDLSRQRMDEYYAKIVNFNPGKTLAAAIRSATNDNLVGWNEIKSLGLDSPANDFACAAFEQNLSFLHRRFMTAGEKSVSVAKELGCEDLLPKTSFGVLDGKFGMFMEFAAGHSGKVYMLNSEKEPGQRVNLLPFDSQQMEDGENLKMVGDLARQMNRLQWLDILTGQLDRHVSNFMVDEKQGDWSKLENIARIQRNDQLVADCEKEHLRHPRTSHSYTTDDVGFAKKMMTSHFVNCGFAEYLHESNRMKLKDLLAVGRRGDST